MEIEIRTERPEDHRRVFAINAAAFETEAEAELVEAVRLDAEPLISLVATLSRLPASGVTEPRLPASGGTDGEVAGHILFSPVTVASGAVELKAMGLGPMAVAPEHQGKGIGSRLVRAGLDACRAIGEHVVVVLGHAEFYPRFGFEPAPAKGLRYRGEEFDPHFFVAELKPGALDCWSGQVRYHPEFEKF